MIRALSYDIKASRIYSEKDNHTTTQTTLSVLRTIK